MGLNLNDDMMQLCSFFNWVLACTVPPTVFKCLVDLLERPPIPHLLSAFFLPSFKCLSCITHSHLKSSLALWGLWFCRGIEGIKINVSDYYCMHPADLAVWRRKAERGGTTYRRAFRAPSAITILLCLMLTNGQSTPVVDYRGAETPASHPSAVFPWYCLHHGRGHILHCYYLHPLCPLPLSLSSSVSFWCQCYRCSVISLSNKSPALLPLCIMHHHHPPS